ncbi:hypothetical protein DFJ73DRAFT_864560 [Zopfochytrium polystomum]|nr:hypothetical protein DFJ73DRAFT_864560 [Zopfochytrium polystomum]
MVKVQLAFRNKSEAAPSAVVGTGNFDGWSQSTTLSQSQQDPSLYLCDIDVGMSPGDKLVYKFVVDGVWQHDPSLPSEVDDGGNLNNFLVIPEPAIVQADNPASSSESSPAPESTLTSLENVLDESEGSPGPDSAVTATTYSTTATAERTIAAIASDPLEASAPVDEAKEGGTQAAPSIQDEKSDETASHPLEKASELETKHEGEHPPNSVEPSKVMNEAVERKMDGTESESTKLPSDGKSVVETANVVLDVESVSVRPISEPPTGAESIIDTTSEPTISEMLKVEETAAVFTASSSAEQANAESVDNRVEKNDSVQKGDVEKWDETTAAFPVVGAAVDSKVDLVDEILDSNGTVLATAGEGSAATVTANDFVVTAAEESAAAVTAVTAFSAQTDKDVIAHADCTPPVAPAPSSVSATPATVPSRLSSSGRSATASGLAPASGASSNSKRRSAAPRKSRTVASLDTGAEASKKDKKCVVM